MATGQALVETPVHAVAPAVALAPGRAPAAPSPLERAVGLRGSIGNRAIARLLSRDPAAAGDAPAAAPATKAVNVVVVGSPGQTEVKLGHPFQFANAAKLVGGTGTDTIWLVERTGYEAGGVELSALSSLAGGAEIRWITPETPLLTRLGEFAPGTIGSLKAYSHGLVGLVALRHDWPGKPDYGLTAAEAGRLTPSIFSPSATIELDSCNAGTNTDGDFTSVAQMMATATQRPAKAYTGRTTYHDFNDPTVKAPQVRPSEILRGWHSPDWTELGSEAKGRTPVQMTFKPGTVEFDTTYNITEGIHTRMFTLTQSGTVTASIGASGEMADGDDKTLRVKLRRFETWSPTTIDPVQTVAINGPTATLTWTGVSPGRYFLDLSHTTKKHVKGLLSVRVTGANPVMAAGAVQRTPEAAALRRAVLARRASAADRVTVARAVSAADRVTLARDTSATVATTAPPAATSLPPAQSAPWASSTLAPKVYDLEARERLLRLFIAMYRQIELVDATDEQRQQAYEAVKPGIQKAIDTIEAIDPKQRKTADKQRLDQLKRMLTVKSSASIAKVVTDWEGTELTADKVIGEVGRLTGSAEVPDWLKTLPTYFAGMHYVSAHGSWLSARHLLFVIETRKAKVAADAAKPKTKPVIDPAVMDDLKGLREDAALQRLRDMRGQGAIPDAAWGKIVAVTNLRLDAGGPATATIDPAAKVEPPWVQLITDWRAGTPPAPWIGEVGLRSWMTALKSGQIVFLQTVCNQLADAAAMQRGIILPGGISENADYFGSNTGKVPADVTAPAGKVAVASYFRHAQSTDDLRPGANLFFVTGTWVENQHGAWEAVNYRSGLDYPNPNDPGSDKDTPGYRPGWNTEALPTDGAEHDGWTYQLVDGKPISRTKKDGTTHWMKWSHESTVMRALGERVFCLETVTGGAGFTERSAASLKTNNAFVGWAPGKDPQFVDAPKPPPAAEGAPPASPPTAGNQ
jgi:hypothetical protein